MCKNAIVYFLYAGTCKGVVFATGDDTRFGRVMKKKDKKKKEKKKKVKREDKDKKKDDSDSEDEDETTKAAKKAAKADKKFQKKCDAHRVPIKDLFTKLGTDGEKVCDIRQNCHLL